MWYASQDQLTIGLAKSTDGINWTKSAANPVINVGSSAEPSVVKDGDTWHMYYMGVGNAIQHISANGPFEFQTIQAAITAASNGDAIQIAAGTYVEDVVVTDKYFNLIGAVDTNGDPISILEGSLFINNPTYGNPPEFTTLKNIYFERTDSHLLNLKNFNGGLIQNCVFDGNNGFLDYQFNGINLEGSTPNGNSNITVLNATFKDGLYVGIGGYAGGLTVQTSEFTNVKSGINLQGGGGNLVVENSTFLTKPVSDGDSYGIRFASSSGSTPNLTVTGSTFTIDDSLGFDPTPTDYHATIIIRAGATGTIAISGNTINNELVGLATVADLDAIYAANVFPFGYGVYGTKITAAPTKLYMSPATAATTGTCGQTFVDVMVNNVTDLTAYHMEVTFDTSKVTVNSVVNGGFLNDTGALVEPTNTTGNTTGRILWGIAQLGTGGDPSPVDGSGSLIRIYFTPKVAGEIVFTIDGTNSTLTNWPEVQPIPFEVTGGATFTFGSVVTNTTKSPTVSYCDLDTAVSAATSGDTLRADVDFTVPTGIAVQKALTLNTNGKTITYSSPNSAMLMVYDAGDLTVTGGGVLDAPNATPLSLSSFNPAITPKITLADATISGGFRSVSIQGAMYPNATPSPVLFTMTGGTTTDGIYINSLGAELAVSGGTVTCTGDVYVCPAPIYGSPSQYSEGTKVTISDTANVISPANIGPAIYQPQDGQLFVTGGTISGLNGINMEAGNLTVSGTPTITGTGGDAILMNGNIEPYYPSDLTANISGGIITSTGGYALRETAPATTRTSNIAVSGGKFTGSLGAVSFTTVDPLILKLTDGAYNTDPGDAPDYVFEPLDTYQSTVDNYYYIEEVLMGRIDELPGFAAANDLTLSGDGTFVGFLGEIPWYPADPDVGRTQANRVAVKISEPTGGYDAAVATMTIGTKTWIWNDIRTTDGWVDVWQKIISVPQTVTVTMKWNNVSTQTLLINILEGSTLALPPEPIITSDDIQGYYLTGEAREFNVNLEMPADGANYALLIFDYKLAGVSMADITKFEFFAQDLGAWIDMGSRAYETYGNCTDNTGICGQFGWAPGGFGPIAAGFTNTTQFRVTFAKGFVAPLSFTLDLSGKLAVTDTAWTKLTTYTGSMDVYDKPTIASTDIQGYYLTGEQREFHVTGSNPLTGGDYTNVMYKVTLPNTLVDDITNIQYYETYPTTGYVPLALTQVGPDVVAWFGLASYGGFPMAPGFSDTPSFLVTFATSKVYSVVIEQYDVALDPDRLLVAETFSATAYTAPVISATFPTGPYAAGVPVTVPVTITNPGAIPGPFNLVLNLPDGTVFTFGGQTYTCTATGCPAIPVTFPIAASDLVITFAGSFSGNVVFNLFDTSWDPDRLVATLTQTGVVVNSGFTVTGNFSMQGNLSRAGVPVTFTWNGDLVSYGPTGYSTAVSGTNFSLALTYGGSYTITTNQPRYLNVYTAVDFFKTINLTGDRLLPELRLRGGNAYWRVVDESNAYTDQYDNTVNGSDASVVGTDWGPNSSSDLTINHGDVNFDGKVNIQDLALVGGNYGLTSAAAYGTTWLP